MDELKQRLQHLFLSRRFLIIIIVIPIITILRWKDMLDSEVFGNILIWLMAFVLGTNTIDKFKDQIGGVLKNGKNDKLD